MTGPRWVGRPWRISQGPLHERLLIRVAAATGDPTRGAFVLGGVLDQGDHAARHEAAGADGLTGPGHLAPLDDAARGGNLDAAARLRRHDPVRLHARARADHHLHPVARQACPAGTWLSGRPLGPAPPLATSSHPGPGHVRWPRAETVRAGRLRTSYLEAGTGDVVTLLHGLGATHASFLPTLWRLARDHL